MSLTSEGPALTAALRSCPSGAGNTTALPPGSAQPLVELISRTGAPCCHPRSMAQALLSHSGNFSPPFLQSCLRVSPLQKSLRKWEDQVLRVQQWWSQRSLKRFFIWNLRTVPRKAGLRSSCETLLQEKWQLSFGAAWLWASLTSGTMLNESGKRGHPGLFPRLMALQDQVHGRYQA
ncbi:uncharacterized protein AAEQ78_005166 [Lycaon pictus]